MSVQPHQNGDKTAGFDLDREKMICFIVLNDDLAPKLSSLAAPAYFRAFILEDRKTHEIFAKMRFRYDTDEANWYVLHSRPEDDRETAITYLNSGIVGVSQLGMAICGIDATETEDAIQCFYLPDDEGTPMKTVLWLAQHNLISVSSDEKTFS